MKKTTSAAEKARYLAYKKLNTKEVNKLDTLKTQAKHYPNDLQSQARTVPNYKRKV